MSSASTSTNPDSMTNVQGEFQPSVPRSEPMTTKGHQVGKLVSEKDKAPEFSAQTLPAGTAPPESTFKPNPVSETPGQADNEDTLGSDDKESTYTSALDTLGGATSGDVHTGLGHPGSGQTSTELRNEGQHTSKRDRTGLDGMTSGGSGLRDDGSHTSRALETEKTDSGPTIGHNVSIEGAEEQVPVTAEEVAAERD